MKHFSFFFEKIYVVLRYIVGMTCVILDDMACVRKIESDTGDDGPVQSQGFIIGDGAMQTKEKRCKGTAIS